MGNGRMPRFAPPQVEVEILAGGTVLAVVAYSGLALLRRARGFNAVGGAPRPATVAYLLAERERRAGWRMPPIEQLPAAALSLSSRIWMGVLRGYLVVAVGLVLFKVIELALGK